MKQCWTVVRVLLLLSITLQVSCQDAITDECRPDAHEVGFFAADSKTRTEMLPDGLGAVWTSGDEISLWAVSSSGEKILENQVFKTYALDGQAGYFTSTLQSPMPDDTYTYFGCYPQPVSADGVLATFSIPSVQDGKVTGGADIMAAVPVQHSALTALPDIEDHSGLSVTMSRVTHQFRFYVPADDELLGDEKIERIIMDFPEPVTGTATLDLSAPDSGLQLIDGQTAAELDLAEPVGVSNGGEFQYACFAFAPVSFAEGQHLQIIKAYTDDKIVYFDSIDLKGKDCQPGHSTPVRLKVRELADYAGIIYMNVDVNNLGENPQKITFTAPSGCKWGDGGSNVFVYEPGREIAVGEVVAFKFETDLDAYLAFSNKEITVTYESENALLEETLTMPAVTSQGSVSVSLAVPYLLFEDFSCIYAQGESYGNNDYASEDRSQPGSSLDGCMSHTGWNAARYWTTGNSIRINTRYQCVKIFVAFASYHHGRLDTPPLTGLKEGRRVNLKVTYDAGGNLHSSSSAEVSNVNLCIATHSNAGVLNGIPTGTSGINSNYDTSLTDFGTRQDSQSLSSDFGDNDFGLTFPTYESEILKADSSTRIVFYVIYTASESFASNAEFNVYLDNIKVQIAD